MKQMKMRRPSQLATFASLVVAEVGAVLFEFPVVTLSYGSFRGQVIGPTTQFLGMPFAAPPYVTTYSVVCKVSCYRDTALVNVALVSLNLPYISTKHVMQPNLEHPVLNKQYNSPEILPSTSLLIRVCRKIVCQTSNCRHPLSHMVQVFSLMSFVLRICHWKTFQFSL